MIVGITNISNNIKETSSKKRYALIQECISSFISKMLIFQVTSVNFILYINLMYLKY